MGLIKYDDKTIINAKTNFYMCNSEIIDALEKINNELLTMESTMSTPKSTKTISAFSDYFSDRTRFVINNRDKYNKMLTNVSKEYNEYINYVEEMVGVKND